MVVPHVSAMGDHMTDNAQGRMQTIDIALWGSDVLHHTAAPVAPDEDVTDLVAHMQHMMEKWDGAGIAAPQVGVSKAVFLWKNPETHEVSVCLNPVITQSGGEQRDPEGCLSLPGNWGPLVRASIVEMQYETLSREAKTIVAKDYLARVFQHEVDHLNGLTIAERITAVQRQLWKKRLKALRTYASRVTVKDVPAMERERA